MSSLPQSCAVPRYERTGFAVPAGIELNEMQGYILLLCGKPHTLTHILNCINTLTLEYRPYCDLYLEIGRLRKLGLLTMHLPAPIPAIHLPTIPNYQSRRIVA